jgi:putative MFS transporter
VTAGSESHRLLTGLGGLAFTSIGLETAIVSFAVLGMRTTWDLSPNAVALVIASSAVGQFVGSVALGQLSDHLGRRAGYGLSVALLSVFTGLAALAPHPAVACALLFLSGAGQGGAAPVVTAMVADAAPEASRGRMVGITELMFACGWALAALAGRTLATGADWRLLLALGAVPVVLAPVGMALIGRESRTAAGTASAGAGLARLWGDCRRPTAVLWVLWLALFGVWFGPVIWLPTLLATAGDPDPAGKASLVPAAMLAGASLVLLVIDRAGRRALIVPGFSVMATGCVVLGLAGSGNGLAAGGIVIGFAGQAIWPVCLTYSAELYASAIRGLGVGWALAAGRVGAIAAPIGLGLLLAAYGRLPALLVFAAVAAAAAAVLTAFRPETRVRGPAAD